MTGLVVEPEERSWHSGTGLLDSGTSLCESIGQQDWVSAALSGVAVGFDALATYSDPLGSLFAAGIGWIIDHLDPIKSWFDDLTGNPEAVAAFAGTWLNVSTSVGIARSDFERDAEQKLGEMKGTDVDAYREHVDTEVQKLQLLTYATRAVSMGLEGAAVIVQFVHGLLRDALAKIAGSICSYAAELVFTLGAATPLVIHQATTRVAALVAEIGPKISGLKTSVTDLDSLMHQLRDILNDIPRFLGDRYSVPNHPGLRWSNVLDDPAHMLQGMSVGDASGCSTSSRSTSSCCAATPHCGTRRSRRAARGHPLQRDRCRQGARGRHPSSGRRPPLRLGRRGSPPGSGLEGWAGAHRHRDDPGRARRRSGSSSSRSPGPWSRCAGGLDLFGVLVLAWVAGLGAASSATCSSASPRRSPSATGSCSPPRWRPPCSSSSCTAGGRRSPTSTPDVRWRRLPYAVRLLDAGGLAIFAVNGALVALSAGAGALASTLIGGITAVGGGVMRDVLAGRVPEVLQRELYALPALLGAALVVLADYLGRHLAAGPSGARWPWCSRSGCWPWRSTSTRPRPLTRPAGT